MKTKDFKYFCEERIEIARHLAQALRSYLYEAVNSIMAVKAEEGKPNMVYLRHGRLIHNPYMEDSEFFKNVSRVRYYQDDIHSITVYFRPYDITEANKTSEDECAGYSLNSDELRVILEDTTDKERVAFMSDEEFAEFNATRTVPQIP